MTSDGCDGQRVDGRRLRYQNRRGEILDAIMAHVLEHGISGLSFRTLAAAVGVSHVTLRHHFGTKDQLLVEIFGAIGTRLPISDHVGADDVETLVRALWQRWTSPEGKRRSQLLFEAYGQAVRSPADHRAFLDRVVANWIAMLHHSAVLAGCPSDEAGDFATLLLAQLRGLQFDFLATDESARISSALESVIDGVRRQTDRWAANAANR